MSGQSAAGGWTCAQRLRSFRHKCPESSPTLPEAEDAVHRDVWLGGHGCLAMRRCLRRLLLGALLLEALGPQERLQRDLQSTSGAFALHASGPRPSNNRVASPTVEGRWRPQCCSRDAQLHGCPTLARSVSMCRRSMCSDRSPASICLSCCSCSAVKEPRQQWAEVGHRMRS